MSAKLRTAVLGATGYSGSELTQLLVRHPRLAKPLLLRREGELGPNNLAETFPALAGNGGYPLTSFSWDKIRKEQVDLMFLATPHPSQPGDYAGLSADRRTSDSA